MSDFEHEGYKVTVKVTERRTQEDIYCDTVELLRKNGHPLPEGPIDASEACRRAYGCHRWDKRVDERTLDGNTF